MPLFMFFKKTRKTGPCKVGDLTSSPSKPLRIKIPVATCGNLKIEPQTLLKVLTNFDIDKKLRYSRVSLNVENGSDLFHLDISRGRGVFRQRITDT